MAKLPDAMKRWGAATILKESARLLHAHGRLFLPFYLAFCIPLSILSVFQSAFLGPSPAPHHVFVKSHFSAQAVSYGSETLLPNLVCLVLVQVLSALATAAFSYTVAYIYSTESDEDDRTVDVVGKILKSLPHAFLRIFVTGLWVFLTILLLYVASSIAGAGLYLLAASLFSDLAAYPFLVGMLVMLPFLSCLVSIAIMFVFAQLVAVLEPQSYGRDALKRSMNLVKAGGAWTVLGVFAVNVAAAGLLLSVPTPAMAGRTERLWEAIAVGVATVALESVISAFFAVVPVVMYFVYKSRFDDVTFLIPEFRDSRASAGSPDGAYQALVPGSDYPRA